MKRLPNLPLFQVVLNTDDREQYVYNINKASIRIRIQQLTADIGVNDSYVLPHQDAIGPLWKLPENLFCFEQISVNKKRC